MRYTNSPPHSSLTNRAVPPRALVLLLLAGMLLPLLAGCGLHPGGEVIAYLRGGALWVINPDGTNAREIAPDPVAGFAWSPNHEWLAYRGAPKLSALQPGSPLGQPDAVGNITVVSINGGSGVTITPQVANLARGNAWWDAQGNRLLYREEPPGNGASSLASYVVAQNDQPLGIASKFVYDAATIPTLAPDGQRVATIDPSGNLRLGPAGKVGTVIGLHAFRTWPLSGRPIRTLWQPGQSAVFYAMPASELGRAAEPDAVALMLQRVSDVAQGAPSFLAAVPDALDLCFSPDGAWLLRFAAAVPAAGLPRQFIVSNLSNTHTSFSWQEDDPAAQAWWSPDARYILIQDHQGLRLATIATGKITTLLTYAQPLDDALSQSPTWTPTDASPWNPDGSGFVFASDISARWQGGALPHGNATSGAALYAVTLAGGVAGTPTLLATGAVAAPTWSYIDPSAALLQGS